MGWYTEGTNGFMYKYGDVVGVALESRLGTLTMTPRLRALDDDGDGVGDDGLEFMGPLQARIQELGLSWSPVLEYSGPGDENLPVPPGADPMELLEQFARYARDNRASIERAVTTSVRRAPPIAEILVSVEFDWHVPSSEFGRLVEWINAGLPADVPALSLEELRRGKLNASTWYEPPDSLDRTFDALQNDDGRRMVARGLAHALLAGEPELYLGQPDDDYQVTAWPEGTDDADDEDAADGE